MEQKLSITQTQRLLKGSVGDVYEILKEDPSFPRPIRRGSRTYFIEKEIFNCLDREDQTFHWISINNINKVKILPSNLKQAIKSYDYNQIHNILKI